jgi:hypothetical protein
MSATASVPLWVPLATAAAGLIGGIGGGLAAAVWTQRKTREREDARWQREREDRADQWRHEDRLRWLQDRQQVYARLLAALYEWDRWLLSGIETRRSDLKQGQRSELDTAERIRVSKAAREALPLVQFMAPESVRLLARHAINDRQQFQWMHLTRSPPDRPAADLSEWMDRSWTRVGERTSSLRDAMRDDLGLESEDEDTGQSGG